MENKFIVIFKIHNLCFRRSCLTLKLIENGILINAHFRREN